MFGLALSTPSVSTCARHQGLAVPSPAVGPPAPRRPGQPQRQQRGGPRAPASSLDDVSAAAAGAAGGEQPPSLAEVQEEVVDYVQHCQEAYGRPGLIDFAPGVNGLPKATLQHPNGASCELYLHGAAVTSWRHVDGREMLHLRQANAFDGESPIRGGVQIAWPQFGVGALPTHGFLHSLHWSVVASGWREPERVPADAVDADTASDWRPTLTLYASTDEEWEQQWPHKFEAAYTVTLMEPDPPEEPDAAFMARAAADFSPGAQQQERDEAVAARARAQRAAPGPPPEEEEGGEQQRARPSVLRCELQVHNCDDKPFTFTTGLRTHFATKDIPRNNKTVRTLGLFGKYVMDYTRNPLDPALWVENSHYVTFGDMKPRSLVYADCQPQGDVLFCPGTPSHFKIHNTRGFRDISVVHPTGAAGREARTFVELGAARALRKVTLQPGETWVGEMRLTAHDEYWPLPAWEVEDPSGVPVPEPTPELLQLRRTPNDAL